MKEEPEDKSNGSTVHQKEHQHQKSSMSVDGGKRRRRSVVLSDSKDEEVENSISEKLEKAAPKSTRSVHAKNKKTKVEHEGSTRMTRSLTKKTNSIKTM